MAPNISWFVDSLKNHGFIPDREREEAQSAKEHLMEGLDEPCGDAG